MEIKEIRNLTRLSQSKFANKYEIPLKTLQNWECASEKSHRECPTYVKKLLEFRVKYDIGVDDE